MKRIGNLFESCFTEENLYNAYLEARKHKRAKRSCFEFEKNLGINLEILRKEIFDGSYTPKPYFKFPLFDSKPRIIYAPAFRDIVVQHAIYRIIYPIFNVSFIDTSFACRKGKGVHACADFVQESLRKCSNNDYVLHLDVKKFFYTIDHQILADLLRKKIKDERLLDIMLEFVKHDQPRGIPIGNLLSQLFALIYLNPLDHFIKRELKIVHYARYVDDMVLIGLSLIESHWVSRKIKEFLHIVLNLSLSKIILNRIKSGLNFVGYRTWRSKRFVRKHSMFKFSRNLKKQKLDSINSLMAHALRTSTLMHYVRRIKQEQPELISMLPPMSKNVSIERRSVQIHK